MASFLVFSQAASEKFQMKKLRLIALFALFFILCGLQNSQAQVVVEEKPKPPEQYMLAPPKPASDYVLIPGHWIWSRQHKMYVWVVPGWVPPKDGFSWRPGYWKEMPRGWKWVPGQWVRDDKKKWFNWFSE